MSKSPPVLFTLRGKWQQGNGRSTYLCATREQAVVKLGAFRHENYTEIEIIGADGSRLTEAELTGRDDGPETQAVAGIVQKALGTTA